MAAHCGWLQRELRCASQLATTQQQVVVVVASVVASVVVGPNSGATPGAFLEHHGICFWNHVLFI